MKNYSVTFKSLRAGTVYTVHIDGGTGAEVPLKGGAQPFTTQEDDNEDMFTPIRTQSGYLRIVDDGFAEDGVTEFDWKDLIPSTDISRPVWLTSFVNGTLVTHWQGFMQSQDFSGVLYGGTQEREFPIQDALATLYSVNMETAYHEPVYFVTLLNYLISKVPSVSFTDYYFGGMPSGGIVDRLRIRVDWQRFFSNSGGEITGANCTCGEALEDFCAFTGWSCRCWGTSLFFVCPDEQSASTYLHLTASDMAVAADESVSDPDSSVGTIASMTDIGSIDGHLVSFDNEEEMARGVSKCVVNAKSGAVSEKNWAFAPKDVHDEMKALPRTIIGEEVFSMTVSSLKTSFESSMMAGSGSNNSGFRYGFVYTKNDDDAEYMTSEEEFDFVSIQDNFVSQSSRAHVVLRTKFAHVFNGYMKFNAKTYTRYGLCTGGERRSMWIRLGVGMTYETAKWYRYYVRSSGSGSFSRFEWSTDKECIPVEIDADDGYWIFQGYNGNNLSLRRRPVFINDCGYIWVEFLGADERSGIIPYQNVRELFVGNLKMECHEDYILIGSGRDTEKVDVVESKSYDASNNSRSPESTDIDTEYASGITLVNGLSHLLTAAYAKLDTLTYGSTQQQPEQHLANRVANFWRKSRRLIRCSVDTSEMPSVSPITTADSYYPLSISHDWRDDTTNLVLIKL
jgi:hypothetical protein